MYALRVAQQAERKLVDALDTTKHWINSGDSSCNCHLYPSDFPRRHGHIFVPSWEYKRTVTALMSSPILSRYNTGAFELAVLQCWKRYLPQGLLCKIYKYDTPTRPPTDACHPLSSLRVKKLQTYLEDLVVMGIDKCRNR